MIDDVQLGIAVSESASAHGYIAHFLSAAVVDM